jgi:hypothetical protein
MADEATSSGWLPPRAPGGRPPPAFEMVTPEAPAPGAARAPAPLPPGLAPVGAAAATRAPARAPSAPRTAFERGRPPATNRLAVTSVVLGVVGLVLLVLTLGLGAPVTLPCSIGAWIYGAQARTRIDLGEEQTGRGQAHAGYLLGVAGVVLGVAAGVGWVVWIAGGGDLEQLQRDLERWRDSQAAKAAAGAALALFGR